MEIDGMHPGPRDPSLLHLQSIHRSTEIWRVGGGDAQRCRRRNPNQTKLPDLDHRMFPLLQSTGFYGAARVSSLQLDWGIITALVERWRPETHTFHLPLGECTITLQDVGVLIGLHVDGDPIIGVTTDPNIPWPDVVASVFGHTPPLNRFNGARLQLSWFKEIVPHKLSNNASEEELRQYVRFYLVQLIGGCLFTDHSGGMIHCMWIPYLRDLDACGGFAWGAAVLAFLYRELCKGCRIDREEIAGCLILLQLWAWERLPNIAPLRTDLPLVDEHFWDGHLAGPLGARWLVGHSFSEKTGRTLSVYRVILDELAPFDFIWMPYSMDILDSLPPYCSSGHRVWRYRGPLICIFIVEPHMTDRVSRQFGMLQFIPVAAEYSKDQHRLTLQGNTTVNWVTKHQSSINFWNSRLDHLFESELIVGDSTVPEYHAWYVERTRRFHSRMGALHAYIGDLLKTIADSTQSVLPDVCNLATQGWRHIQDRSLYGLFEAHPLDERRDKEKEGRKLDGRRPKRGGHGGGRGGARRVRRRADGVVDQVVPAAQGEVDHDAAHLEDDDDHVLDEGDRDDADVEPAHVNDVADHDADAEPAHVIPEEVEHFEANPSSDVSTPIDEVVLSQPIQEHSHQEPIHDKTQEPVQQFVDEAIPNEPIHKEIREPVSSCPSFNLGLTPGGSLLPTQELVQSRQSPEIASDPSVVIDPSIPVASCPSFNLGLTPGGSLLPTQEPVQSRQSPEIPLTQAANDPSIPSISAAKRYSQVYEPRRSKRLHKNTKRGTAGHKIVKKP